MLRVRFVQQHKHPVQHVKREVAMHGPQSGVVGLDAYDDVAAIGHVDRVFANGVVQFQAGHGVP